MKYLKKYTDTKDAEKGVYNQFRPMVAHNKYGSTDTVVYGEKDMLEYKVDIPADGTYCVVPEPMRDNTATYSQQFNAYPGMMTQLFMQCGDASDIISKIQNGTWKDEHLKDYGGLTDHQLINALKTSDGRAKYLKSGWEQSDDFRSLKVFYDTPAVYTAFAKWCVRPTMRLFFQRTFLRILNGSKNETIQSAIQNYVSVYNTEDGMYWAFDVDEENKTVTVTIPSLQDYKSGISSIDPLTAAIRSAFQWDTNPIVDHVSFDTIREFFKMPKSFDSAGLSLDDDMSYRLACMAFCVIGLGTVGIFHYTLEYYSEYINQKGITNEELTAGITAQETVVNALMRVCKLEGAKYCADNAFGLIASVGVSRQMGNRTYPSSPVRQIKIDGQNTDSTDGNVSLTAGEHTVTLTSDRMLTGGGKWTFGASEDGTGLGVGEYITELGTTMVSTSIGNLTLPNCKKINIAKNVEDVYENATITAHEDCVFEVDSKNRQLTTNGKTLFNKEGTALITLQH